MAGICLILEELKTFQNVLFCMELLVVCLLAWSLVSWLIG
jgi:hypothetical protein